MKEEGRRKKEEGRRKFIYGIQTPTQNGRPCGCRGINKNSEDKKLFS
ncbi:MAG: hypothetical protein KME60_26705 [Cyanomargarita calcarea GSE-NOS-MK-12-04C]|jgi:hypothetical protein|uniref:Uncharacterized protein n=1 Tax=Cyanomargarita calcarea GSE-NOS-MK-12-04C TaxID=2839659 RepID=A0A951UVH1_9CYAN|nr:hypothetical protein [Cyanomargarita calcarea GSE-NOS-MK-12-04C]